MESLFYYFVIFTAIALLGTFLGIYLHFREQYKFWKKLNIPYIPASFPMGNFSGIGSKIPMIEFSKHFYDMSPGKPVVGIYMFSNPLLIVRDPEIIKAILTKNFMTFQGRGTFQNSKDDPLGANMFRISGVKWRNLRAKLSPTFTSGKMKMMFPILLECSEELKDLLKEPASRGEVVEMKDIAARFTTDIISSCALGIKTKTMENPKAMFRVMGKKIFESSFVGNLLAFFISSYQDLGRHLRMALTSPEVTKFFVTTLQNIMEYREKNNIERKDLLDVLLQLKNQGRLEDVDGVQSEVFRQHEESHNFTLMDATAQSFVFFAASFGATATTILFALYELALNPDIQDRLREEIRDTIAKDNGKITYEGIHSMEYLGRIIDETLRKHPPVATLPRKCNDDFRMPSTDWVIPKGTEVRISVSGIHHDPQYYPNPEKFDPDRFTEQEKATRRSHVYLPFGDGPRHCIGMRFGFMQTRVGLVTLVGNFRFEVSEKTTVPFKLEMNSVLPSPEGGMHLKIIAIK